MSLKSKISRGPLAGPVVAAAVILPREFKLLGLNDSKQLNEETRNEYFTIIKNEAVSYGISMIDNQKIDQVNIYEATKLAMYNAIWQLNPAPDHILIDAVSLDQLSCTSESITKGDQESISIAAASILAKVTRDNLMKEIHKDYPAYGFASNMGYGTKQHLDTLTEQGVSPYHRKSFSPVHKAVSQ
ncbi:RNase HII [Lentibacillus halodurans]|uniref:Ribonuclease HII n=1 Tax=Lentibacillus halodurans TaxID=237679 RepID=A0A1I0Z7Q8_9BACI|nr:ribonuclease HII [Lentibacillus halodurans]SFB20590.1 RNase HII [Lentibacillus halodurans]